MSTYEYLCKRCERVFELFLSMAEHQRMKKKGKKCPKCGSSRVEPQISSFEVKTSKKS